MHPSVFPILLSVHKISSLLLSSVNAYSTFLHVLNIHAYERSCKNIAWLIYYLVYTLFPAEYQNKKHFSLFFFSFHFLCILFPLPCSLKFKNCFVSWQSGFTRLSVRECICSCQHDGRGGVRHGGNFRLVQCASRSLESRQRGAQRIQPGALTHPEPRLGEISEFRYAAYSY